MKDADTVFDIAKIKSILPHRYPFLLVDKIIEFEAGKRAVGVKKARLPHTTRSWPRRAQRPPRGAGHGQRRVLQWPLSRAADHAGCAAGGGDGASRRHRLPTGADHRREGDFFFAGVNNVKWRRPVVPGDTLTMEMELTAFKAKFGLVKMKESLTWTARKW